MEKLERLVQDEGRYLYKKDNTFAEGMMVGKIMALPIENFVEIDSVVDEWAKNDSAMIPKGANAYVASDFNAGTQFEKNGKIYSCYALQFYWIYKE